MSDNLRDATISDVEQDCCIEEVGDMVRRLVRVFQIFERDQIRIFGFTSSQCYALLEIMRAGSLTMNQLSNRMNLDTSTVTRVIGNLVRDGLIERDRDPSDRRIVIVRLTEKGREAAKQLNDSINEYYREIIVNLPEGQVDDVLRSVSVLLTAFEKANPGCC